MNSYKDLIVWKKSFDLVKEIYILTEKFPKSEIFGLSNQMRRAAVSVPSNIAEGYSRKHNKEFHQFIRIAFGSATELETQLLIAENIKMTKSHEFQLSKELILEVLKMLNKLSSVLRVKS